MNKQLNQNIMLYNTMLQQAKDILEYNSFFYEQIHPIFSYIKQLTDLMTYESGIRSLTEKNNGVAEEINDFFVGFGTGNKKIKHITMEKPHPDDFFADRNKNYYLYEHDIQLDFNVEPIIINPWYDDRTISAIKDISTKDNKFDAYSHKWNISNCYYYPIGVTLCRGGNHSQYSAKLKGNENTLITSIIDIREIYKTKIFEPTPFMDKYELYTGILFEIGRILENYEQVFPNKIQECLKICEEII